MGVLSDLVVATEGDALRIARTTNPAATFGGIDIKGIDSVKFGTLQAILTGSTFEELLHLYEPVCESDEGPWVFRIPAAFVAKLAVLEGIPLERTAIQWAQTEELEGWDTSAVVQALHAICEFARRAAGSGQALFLWMCL